MRKIENKLLIISFAGGEKQIVESGYILTKDKTNFVRNSNIKTFGWQLELFFFIAENEKEGCIITAVYEINADGSTPRVGFRNSPDFKKNRKMGEERLNHPEASNSNYWGNNKGNLTNILNEFENEPEMEEILVCGKVVISKKYVDVETNMIITLRIIKYKNSFYFTEFDNKGYLSFKKIR